MLVVLMCQSARDKHVGLTKYTALFSHYNCHCLETSRPTVLVRRAYLFVCK